MVTLSSPLPADWSVRRARDAYLAENGFTVEAYDAKWTDASFFGVPFKVPNTRRHRWAIMLHDLHHVATGYGTDLTGEGEVSAFELRPGIRALGPYITALVVTGTLGGFVVAPRRTWRAWGHASSTRSLLTLLPPDDEDAYEALLDLSLGDLRERLALPRAGVATAPRRLHDFAPALVERTNPAPPRRPTRPSFIWTMAVRNRLL